MANAPDATLLLALAGGAALGWWLRGRRTARSTQGLNPAGRRRPSPGEHWPLPPEQLRQWLEGLPQGWLVLAPDGSIASLNSRAKQLLGLDQALALLGQPLAVLDPGDDVMHLVALARDKGVAQRGSWMRPGTTLELRVMPGSRGISQATAPTGMANPSPLLADVAGIGRAPACGLIDHINGITLFDKIIRPALAAVRRAGEVGAGLCRAVNHHDRVGLGDLGGDAVFDIHLAGHDLPGFGVDILAAGE